MTEVNPAAAGLPQDALTRLRDLEAVDGKRKLFTSDLSVNEFLLVKQAGFEPLGLVVGSSIYHIGIQVKLGQSCELDKLSQAMYEARELAMSRMEAEADALGADGVVGVRLDINFYEWGENMGEFIALGTAVKANDTSRSWRNNENKPFTSDLSGQDFWTLLQSGYAPLGLVMGTCVYHVGRRGFGQWMTSIGQNQEMPNFTQALYEARELAMERMQSEAERLEAQGIVEVKIEEKSHQWGSHTIEFFAVGTAITPLREDHTIDRPTMILSLDS